MPFRVSWPSPTGEALLHAIHQIQPIRDILQRPGPQAPDIVASWAQARAAVADIVSLTRAMQLVVDLVAPEGAKGRAQHSRRLWARSYSFFRRLHVSTGLYIKGLFHVGLSECFVFVMAVFWLVFVRQALSGKCSYYVYFAIQGLAAPQSTFFSPTRTTTSAKQMFRGSTQFLEWLIGFLNTLRASCILKAVTAAFLGMGDYVVL